MNLIPIIVAALRPQVDRMPDTERRAAIERIHALTGALLAGQRGEATLLLEGLGADPGMVDLVIGSFCLDGNEDAD